MIFRTGEAPAPAETNDQMRLEAIEAARVNLFTTLESLANCSGLDEVDELTLIGRAPIDSSNYFEACCEYNPDDPMTFIHHLAAETIHIEVAVGMINDGESDVPKTKDDITADMIEHFETVDEAIESKVIELTRKFATNCGTMASEIVANHAENLEVPLSRAYSAMLTSNRCLVENCRRRILRSTRVAKNAGTAATSQTVA